MAEQGSGVIDAFMENHLVHTPVRTDVPVRQALESHLRSLIRQYAGPPGRLVAQILAEGQYDPETRAAFRERFFADRYRAIVELVQRGIDNGELSPNIDPGCSPRCCTPRLSATADRAPPPQPHARQVPGDQAFEMGAGSAQSAGAQSRAA